MGVRVPDGTIPPSHFGNQKRKNWDAHRASMRRTNKARQLAAKRLIAEHEEEYSAYLCMEFALLAGEADCADVVPTPHGQEPMTEREALVMKIALLQEDLRRAKQWEAAEAEEAEGDG